jgi:hypothetical protein
MKLKPVPKGSSISAINKKKLENTRHTTTINT